MRALNVQFAPEPAWKSRLLLALLVLCSVAAAIGGWHAWAEWKLLKQAQQDLQGLQASQTAQEAARRSRLASLAAPKPTDKDALRWARIAGFPTEQVLRALETTQVEGVKVTAIDLNPESGTARVELEFTDQRQLVRYEEQINAGETAPRWTLLQAKKQRSGSLGTATIVSNWSDLQVTALRNP